jgi:hypothetical protein
MGVTVVGPKRDKKKMVQFWLGDACIKALAQTLEIGPDQRARVARRLTDFPEFLSHWKDWRNRTWPGRSEAQA